MVKFSQFSGNFMFYDFGSCIYDSTYIVVSRSFLISTANSACAITILINWAKYEFKKSPPNSLEGKILMDDFDAIVSDVRCSCQECREFIKLVINSDETAIYNRILLYPEIFDNHVLNFKTGRPVLEEMFSFQLEPFFYIWHLASSSC